MHLEEQLQTIIQTAFQQVFALTIPLQEVRLQPTRKEFEGDYTLVTFPFAASCKASPEETARKLGEYMVQNHPIAASFNVVKGFLNLAVADQVWLEQFAAMRQAERFGYAPSNSQKVVIESASPNTNKPLHLGHLRNIFLGHAVSQILQAAGYEVYKVNLVNDRGIHICKSMVAYQRWGQGSTPESTGLKGDHLVGKCYVQFEQAYQAQVAKLTQELGDKEQAIKQAPILKEAQAMLQLWEAGDPDVVALWEKLNNWVYQGFEITYRQLDITFDKVYYESQVYLLGKEVVADGLKKDIFYRKQDGSIWVDLTDEGLDEKLLLRADGTSVYITQDIGAADLRYQDFQTSHLIYVVGDEQDYHFEVLTKIMRRLGRPYAAGMYHLSYGMVDLPSGKMKSREGTVVDADSLIEEMVETAAQNTEQLGKISGFSADEAQQLYHMLAMGALKYFLLRVDAKKRLLFDPQASIDFQGDTGPFIQYTHARIAAILRKAKQAGINTLLIDVPQNLALQLVERELIVQLSKFPYKLQEAAETYAPALIAQYVLGVAKAYNRFYAELPILHATEVVQQRFRIQLSTFVAQVLREAMYLLGIQLPERM
jgi:arginyl-tRNA synthetase